MRGKPGAPARPTSKVLPTPAGAAGTPMAIAPDDFVGRVISPRHAARPATRRGQPATCLDSSIENPAAQAGCPVTQDRISGNLDRWRREARWPESGPSGPTPG